jgi:hypothetical protein
MKNSIKVMLLYAFFWVSTSYVNAQLRISARIAPPVLEVYTQPYCPGDGYLWTPGYWAYGADGYYWIPGVWVMPPSAGLLWTPGYWGFIDGLYEWYPGYWGATVGYYGGINYGFGYFGTGFSGGRWQGGHFYYNTAVSRINTKTIHNIYKDKSVKQNYARTSHASFNGSGGVTYKAQTNEKREEPSRQTPPTSQQNAHYKTAVQDKGQFSSPQRVHPSAFSMDRIGGNHFNAGGRMMGGRGGGRH